MLPRATQHGHGALELRILFVPGFWAWRLFRFSVFISILMGPLKDLGSPLKRLRRNWCQRVYRSATFRKTRSLNFRSCMLVLRAKPETFT